MKKMNIMLLLFLLIILTSILPAQGLLIGDAQVISTGAKDNFQRIIIPVNKVKGVHSVTLVWKNHSSAIRNINFDYSENNTHLQEHPKLLPFFKQNGDLILFEHVSYGTEITISDISGRVYSSFIANNSSVERKIPKGFYIVRFSDTKGWIYSSKIIIK